MIFSTLCYANSIIDRSNWPVITGYGVRGSGTVLVLEILKLKFLVVCRF